MTETPLPTRCCLAITELETGGAETALVNLATGLHLKQYKVRVVSLAPLPRPPRDSLLKRLHSAAIPVDTLQVTSARQILFATRKLVTYLREHQVDLLQTFLYHANVVGSLAARKNRQLVQVSGIRVADPSRCRQRVERWASRKSKHTVCVSRDVADFAQEQLRIKDDLISVIPNGVDATRFTDLRAERQTLLPKIADRRWLLTIGRLTKQKGLDWLLALAPALLQQCPEHDLVLVGDGDQRLALEDQAKQAGIHDRVHFLGWRADVPQLLHATDLLLLPSRWEGMPNVLLEAMASGLAVASRPVHGVTEILGENAESQIAHQNSSDDFRQCVIQLLANSDHRLALGQRNRERVLKHFTLEAMVEGYATLYRRLLSTR